MVRKRIPFVTRTDPDYAASLPSRERPASEFPTRPTQRESEGDFARSHDAGGPPEHRLPLLFPATRDPENTSTQIDVRVTALARQEAALLGCGIAPAQVIRASLRRAVRRWQLAAVYVAPSPDRRAKEASWTARTSVAVPAALFDRLQAAQDPLGVCSRWSLVRGQLEPLIWEEIDLLLASLAADEDAP